MINCFYHVFLLIELLSLSFFASFISSLLLKKIPKLHPNQGVIPATLFSILSPTCLCTNYPILLTIQNPWIRYYTAICSSLLSPFVILFSLSLIGGKYTILRISASLLFASISSSLLHLILKTKIQKGNKTLSTTIKYDLTYMSLWDLTVSLFKATVPLLLLTWVISVSLESIFSLSKVGKLALYPSTQLLSIPVAMATKFCFGQETVLIKALSGLPIKMGFKLAISLAGTGFCISSIPVYTRIFGIRGTIIYAILVLLSGILLTFI